MSLAPLCREPCLFVTMGATREQADLAGLLPPLDSATPASAPGPFGGAAPARARLGGGLAEPRRPDGVRQEAIGPAVQVTKPAVDGRVADRHHLRDLVRREQTRRAQREDPLRQEVVRAQGDAPAGRPPDDPDHQAATQPQTVRLGHDEVVDIPVHPSIVNGERPADRHQPHERKPRQQRAVAGRLGP